MRHAFLHFSQIERHQACHIFYKQSPNEDYSQICLKYIIWKQIH